MHNVTPLDCSSYYANVRNGFVIHVNVTKIVIIILVNKRVVRDPGRFPACYCGWDLIRVTRNYARFDCSA